MAGGLGELNEAEVIDLAYAVRRDTSGLVRELEPLLPITPYLAWLPRFGPLMPVAGDLLGLADSGTELLVLLVDGLSPALPVVSNAADAGIDIVPDLLDVLANSKPQLNASAQTYSKVELHLQNILSNPEAVEALPWTVRSNLPTIEPLLPLIPDLLKLSVVLPELAARDTEKTYLLIAQNEDELRPTGGFISGAGPVVLSDGRLASMAVEDAYNIDDFLNKPYDFPPGAINEFMNIDLFLFRDANYWPDFPTSATKLMELYTYGQDRSLDGIIAIDQNFLYDLVEVLEPIEVAELGITLTGETVQSYIQDAWATGDEEGDWRTTRKSFLGPMANGVMAKLEKDIFEVDLLALADLIQSSIDTKSLQIYIDDPQIEQVLAQIGWDGRVNPPTDHDLLMIIDHNMGTNKVNYLISSQIEYSINLLADGDGQAANTVIYQHHGEETGETCQAEQVQYVRGLQYSDLVNLCYWNYFRLYVPLGSQLQQSTKHEIPAELMLTQRAWSGISRQKVDDQLGLAYFDNFLLVPRGESQTIQSIYSRPNAWTVAPDGVNEYTLRVIKQAGRRPHPLITITVTLPPDQTFVSATPQPTALDQSVVQFKTELNKDLEFKIQFK